MSKSCAICGDGFFVSFVGREIAVPIAKAIRFGRGELIQKKAIDAGDEVGREIAGNVEQSCVWQTIFGGAQGGRQIQERQDESMNS